MKCTSTMFKFPTDFLTFIFKFHFFILSLQKLQNLKPIFLVSKVHFSRIRLFEL